MHFKAEVEALREENQEQELRIQKAEDEIADYKHQILRLEGKLCDYECHNNMVKQKEAI